MDNWQKWIVGCLVVLLSVATTFVAGFGIGHYVIPPADALVAAVAERHQDEFGIFWEAWRAIEDNFYTTEPLDAKSMTYGAIRGMVASLGDRHTTFLEPAQADLFRQDLQGQFSGIGATVSVTEEGHVRIVRPLPGAPAEKAGLRPGDIILEVDGMAIQGMDLIQAIMLIRGLQNTSVTLLIDHASGGMSEVVIERALITVPTTEIRVVEGDIAYLALWECNSRAPREVRDGLRTLLKANPPALIFDLRGNPGGYLHVAKEVASEFIDRGLLLIERGSDGSETRHEARAGGLATQIPLVVLVDGASASAAEIIAGAIQDHQRGVLIGEKTFGKGSVQTTQRLSDGSALQITIRRWYTPDDRQIQGQGLTPDIEVAMAEEDLLAQRDPQLQRAVSYLLSQAQK
jgi:carboxyl-terminal processing protease